VTRYGEREFVEAPVAVAVASAVAS
jgi:hypothetical protein